MKHPTKEVKATDKQWEFLHCKKRYVCCCTGWGWGKTMWGILKGLSLSETPGNLGLICRKNFTDLRDSTMKDFERYTGLSIRKDDKEVHLDNGSVIMFRHADELSKLQNVNLGWYMMEQGEEFETDEQFQMLRGRLRREGAFHQGIVIANTAGHNWIWNLWKSRKLEDFALFEATSFDNPHLPEDFLKDLERMKLESPKKYNRFVLNSWEDYDLEGAYYASLMSDALKDNRCERKNLWDRKARVYTFWDLGVRASDTTVIWCVQFVGHEIRLIDYYENYGKGIEHYCQWLDRKPYIYESDWLPPDAKNRLQGRTIDTRYNIVNELRKNQVHLVDEHKIETRIAETRIILPKCVFDEKCARGVEALNHYKAKKNETLSTEGKLSFGSSPLHDWSSNAADSLGYMAMAYRYQITDPSGQLIGYPGAISTQHQYKRKRFSVLNWRRRNAG